MLRRRYLASGVSTAILVALLIFSFIPVIMMVMMSFKDSLYIYLDFFALPNPIQWSNYSTALLDLVGPAARTLVMAAISIAGIMFFSCLAAYAFARLKFLGKEFLFYLIIFIFLVP